MYEIIFHGRGGQGAVTSAALLVLALAEEGKYGQAFPKFGSERRGAPVSAFLRIDNEPIIYRSSIKSPDCIVVLDSKLPEIINVAAGLKEGGMAVLNTSKGPEELNLGVRLAAIGTVNATRLAFEIYGSTAMPITNMAMLGAFAATTGWITLPSIVKAMQQRYKGSALERNVQAMQQAYDATRVFRR